MENQILIFQAQDGSANLEVRVQDERVWLSLTQLSDLFERDKSVISRHLKTIFSGGELSREAVVAKKATTAADGKVYQVEYFNLDVIISVGYRINSKIGTQFRIWANKVRKDLLLKGYTLNEKRLRQQQERLREIQQTLLQFQQSVDKDDLTLQEAKGLLSLIAEYAKSFTLLSQFDTNEVDTVALGEEVVYELDYRESLAAIAELKQRLIERKEASDLLGRIRNDGFRGILGSVAQTFGGQYLSPTIEEQAAHLLYFVIKNHPFSDGNKRIRAFLFIWFLEKNRHRLKKNGALKINENALAALALLVAQSDPASKELMIQLIMNLIKND